MVVNPSFGRTRSVPDGGDQDGARSGLFDHHSARVPVQGLVALRIRRERLGATSDAQDDLTRPIGRYRNRDTPDHPGHVFIRHRSAELLTLMSAIVCTTPRVQTSGSESYPRVKDRRPRAEGADRRRHLGLLFLLGPEAGAPD